MVRRVSDLTESEARGLTDRIRGRVTDVLELIAAAFEGRADVALGYVTWAHYCLAEFPAIRYQNREQREAAVAQLGQHGMSGRAIGHALGVGETTARADLRRARNAQALIAPNSAIRNSVQRLNGGVYPPRRDPPSCPPVRIRATIRNALIHYSRQVAALLADLDAQDYPPGFLTPAEVAAIDQFRQAARDFTQTTEREHTARMAREDSE
jgi:hypothetical protein